MTATALTTVEHPPPNSSGRDDSRVIDFESSALSSTQDLKLNFSQQLSEHHRNLLVYARAIVYDADQSRDLVQEACITAWSKFSTYDPEQSDFGTWMRGILRNKVRDWAKSRKGGKRPEITLDDAHLDYLDHHFATEAPQPRFTLLKTCLDKLPTELRKAIQLTYYLGACGEEASVSLGIQHTTLRKRLSRARQALHSCLTQQD